jgi:hypothetical protein
MDNLLIMGENHIIGKKICISSLCHSQLLKSSLVTPKSRLLLFNCKRKESHAITWSCMQVLRNIFKSILMLEVKSKS